MQFEGHVENGVVVFDQQNVLVEGTKVLIEAVPTTSANIKPPRTLAERYAAARGIAPDLPADMAQRHDHYIHGTSQ